MSNDSNLEYIDKILRLYIKYERLEALFWDLNEYDEIVASVNCNDLFSWASADAEDITPENFNELKKAHEDLYLVDETYGPIYANELFAARVRQMRPQGAAYPKDKGLWPLFDACGPEREIGFGNPYKPGEYKK